ncbi:MAG: hypothetical protein ACNS61_08845 [Candidatus Wenzhouxiangella sp. M2_3B_020]
MRHWLGSVFQRNAHSLARRLYFGALRRFRAVFSKRQSVHFVTINGKRFKRVVLGDSFEAAAVEDALARAPESARFPPLIQRHENELLLGFVEGRRFDPGNQEDLDRLAGFLAALYASPRISRPSRPLRRQLEIDTAFLADAGIIDERLADSLRSKADDLQLSELEFGLDYVDPVTKNFVISEGHLYAIDVESLHDDAPIGTAIAKAGVHWLERERLNDFLAAIEPSSGGAFRDQYPFVELCFRVGWTKRKLLQGKHRSIRPELLRELVD